MNKQLIFQKYSKLAGYANRFFNGCLDFQEFEDMRSKNPFAFMELQDVQELANFFERRVSAYQVAMYERIRTS